MSFEPAFVTTIRSCSARSTISLRPRAETLWQISAANFRLLIMSISKSFTLDTRNLYSPFGSKWRVFESVPYPMFTSGRHRRGGGGAGEDEGGDEETGLAGESDGEGDDLADLVGLTAGTAGMKALVSVPTQLAMEAELIARKKAMLMKMFVDDDEETEE